MLTWAEKVASLGALLDGLTDARQKPRIATSVIVRSLLVMIVTRLGSLNAAEQTRSSLFWRRFLKDALPSADTLGRVAAQMEPDAVRKALQEVYTDLKRNKALPPPWHGLMPLILDGHEPHSTEHRHCPECLQRTISTAHGEHIQYYHRSVVAMLLGRDFPILLDAEAQRPGEDEIATALRLLERLLKNYPRAFDVVLGDALYTDPRLYNFLLDHGKDVLTVLKNENRTLITDARALFETHEPQSFTEGSTTCEVWDISGFTTWPQVRRPVRVVRSRETTSSRRQLDGQLRDQEADWLWVTTLSANRASTQAVVSLGHARWNIENQGFNETTNRWAADHVYKHHPTAILVFSLMTMLAFNLFYAFYYRNLQPAYRSRHDAQHVARCLTSEIYQRLAGESRSASLTSAIPAPALARPCCRARTRLAFDHPQDGLHSLALRKTQSPPAEELRNRPKWPTRKRSPSGHGFKTNCRRARATTLRNPCSLGVSVDIFRPDE